MSPETSTPQIPQNGAEIAYGAMAPYYDEFTSHHDYDAWLEKLMPVLRGFGLPGNRLLDVGCGTGKSFQPLLNSEWRITACDISERMLQRARSKAGSAVRLETADMRSLPVFGSFDLVWALDDAVNYLLTVEELERALAGMRANLVPGGLLLFDLNTIKTYRTFFAEEDVRECGEYRLIWRGLATPDAPAGGVAEAVFEVRAESSGEIVEPASVHRQRHFPAAAVLETLRASDLDCLGVFGIGFDAVMHQPLDEHLHTKAIFVARASKTSR